MYTYVQVTSEIKVQFINITLSFPPFPYGFLFLFPWQLADVMFNTKVPYSNEILYIRQKLHKNSLCEIF